MRSDVSRQAGWLLLACAALAAAAAALQPGSLSQVTAKTQDGRLHMQYNRVEHANTPTRLRLWVAPGLAQDGVLRIRMSQRYTRLIRIGRITPEPLRVETGLEDIIFVFAAGQDGTPATVVFEIKPMDVGRLDGRVAVVGDRSVEFRQYMIP